LIYFQLPVLERLRTELRNPASASIDTASTAELLAIINAEDQKVAPAVASEIPQIARALDAIVERYQRGGRLFYIGAGTSGRLGVLDAAECPPTFGVAPGRVQALIAGGDTALRQAVEASEDRYDDGRRDLEQAGFQSGDALVGISASGRAPYVLGAVDYARSLGALTVGLGTNPEGDLARRVDISIAPGVGPEVIAGSTRMKSGSAQKLVLNMLSTGLMVRMGYVLGNLMVNVQIKNEKLLDRGRRIVAEVAGCGTERAAEVLVQSGNRVRIAILMARFGISPGSAEERLAKAGDRLSAALNA
jgi:N-acetylmuramic acid 6-phosphate etherase